MTYSQVRKFMQTETNNYNTYHNPTEECCFGLNIFMEEIIRYEIMKKHLIGRS